ncbi:MAG: ACT domain-containing protein, partial [Acetomicrobium sp.]|nr:ACT domain-containing protein [Acetomicrobium sp.]
TKAFYTTRLRLEAVDRAGLFADVTQAISAAEGSIISISAHVVDESRARMNMEIQVKDVEQLYRIIARINSIEGVLMVLRG